jgi:sigma-B regulation protein RsbQ
MAFADIINRNNVKVLNQENGSLPAGGSPLFEHPAPFRLAHPPASLAPGKTAMIFAHGFGCDQNMWRFVAPAFTDDYQVVLFDYVGCGRSDCTAYDPGRYATLDGYAADIIDVCAALDISHAVFVGHSVSSVIGILASLKAPDLFNQLVLIGPSPRYIDDPPEYVGGFSRPDLEGLLDMMDKNYIGWASFLAPIIMKNSETPELSQELQDSFCSTDPVTARGFAQATFFADNRAELPLVSARSLIMQCADDAIAPREVGEYMHRHLRGSTLRYMEATGHCPHMSHPAETIRIMKEHLGAIQPASSIR